MGRPLRLPRRAPGGRLTLCAQACNPTSPRLQPYVAEAATLCDWLQAGGWLRPGVLALATIAAGERACFVCVTGTGAGTLPLTLTPTLTLPLTLTLILTLILTLTLALA